MPRYGQDIRTPHNSNRPKERQCNQPVYRSSAPPPVLCRVALCDASQQPRAPVPIG